MKYNKFRLKRMGDNKEKRVLGKRLRSRWREGDIA